MTAPFGSLRVVSLVASNTEIVCALGRGDLLVGVDNYSDHPPAVVAGLPRVGPDLEIDVERVAALEPDLILASLSVPGMERNLERLRARELPTVVVESGGLRVVFDAIHFVGELLEAENSARGVVDSLRSRMAAVEQRVSQREPLRTLWEWWPRPPIAAGGPSWITEMLAFAGAANVFAGDSAESRVVSLEEVLAHQPRAVVLCWCGARKLPNPALLARRPGWAALQAVRRGQVFSVLEPLYGRPGPRLAEGVEELAGLLHPDLCPRPA